MPDSRPALVVCAHGTDDPDGRQVVVDIVDQVRRARPDLQVHDAYVDVQQPGLDAVVDRLAPQAETVIVPLLLSAGFHVEVDVARAARHPHVRAAGSLGPHPLLADVLVDRLGEAGARDDDAVVVAVAGSSRPAGADDAEQVRGLVAARWPGPVSVGFCSANEPRVATAVDRARTTARGVSVASYLVGPGFFHRGLEASGADVVSAPLGPDARVVRTVLSRHQEASGQS